MTVDCGCYLGFFFFFKQKTAYEMRISDWSSDVCSSDLGKNGYGLAWADLAGGRFLVNEVSGDDALEAELARLDPAELLLPDEDGWPPFVAARGRSDERRVGKECVSTGRSRWAPDH